MKYRYAFIVFLIAFILQGTVLNIVAINGTTPNLILCLVVLFSFLYERQPNCGLVFGTFFGLVSDICFMPYTGVSALGYFLVGLGVILANSILNKENFVSVIIISIVSTFVYNVYIWAVYLMFGTEFAFSYIMKQIPLMVALNLAVMGIMYAFFIRKVVRFRSDRHYI